MRLSSKYATMILTESELNALPVYSPSLRYGEPEGYYRSQSPAVGHAPMVMTFQDHPLGMQEVWYSSSVEISESSSQMSFNSCSQCRAEFKGATGASDWINHFCTATSLAWTSQREERL